MKALYLVVVLAMLPACGNQNDVKQLQEEADVVAKYYPAKLDAVDKRVQNIFKRGTTIPANLPGIEEVGKRLTEARDTIIQLRGIVTPEGLGGKSPVEKQAEIAAKARKPDDLLKLIDDTEQAMENGLRVITEDLDAVESWIANYDQGLAKRIEGSPTPPPAPPPSSGQASPPPGETAAPATPGQPPTAPNAGQPPAPQPAGHP